jgi:hypothetical protein
MHQPYIYLCPKQPANKNTGDQAGIFNLLARKFFSSALSSIVYRNMPEI